VGYEKPEIRTIGARALLEALGPASALQSGGGSQPSASFDVDPVKPNAHFSLSGN
jgi:hypothetical protein